MYKNNVHLIPKKNHSSWLTIQEAVEIVNLITPNMLTDGDIYRYALHENIRLSIYFQSPVVLRRVQFKKNKIKIRLVENSFINRLCFLEKNSLINEINLMVSTEDNITLPSYKIIDTTLIGLEYIATQRLLAQSLGIPSPITGANDRIHGISVNISGETFLIFERTTWQDRIESQIFKLPQEYIIKFHNNILSLPQHNNQIKEYFPLHNLPNDACFVIRDNEFEKLINLSLRDEIIKNNSTRISTPLSRLFWLACKHNETISPLIRHPYKLLSIFEQWASADGITDRFSGDTLKTALQRGSPSSTSD
ncbi:hypothetical protein [Citrobacter freundii]|uniref:hypothetical protein n=1 Tax=Citrobacter freundii TaxID=546 RepID=UPI00397C0160